MKGRKYHIVVWGATGFTGKLVAEYLTKHSPKETRFAIAGRSAAKLQAVATQLCAIDASRFPDGVQIIIANSNEQKSLDDMVIQARVVITTVGPYIKYGMCLVDSCVRLKTDYLDLTGEPGFVKEVIARYHKLAQDNGVLIVHSAGFDSIPSDLGTLLICNDLKKQGLEIDNVRFSLRDARGSVSGGTIASLCNMLDHSTIKALRESVNNPDELTPRTPDPKTWKGTMIYYDDGLKLWQTPFVMEQANMRIVRRTNHLLEYGPNFQYCEGVGVKNFVIALFMTIITAFIGILMLLKPIRYLVQKFIPTGSGPSLSQIREGYFDIRLYGEGRDKLNDRIVSSEAIIKGVQDPGYGETAKMISEAAMALAFDRKKCAEMGAGSFKAVHSGVATPASAIGFVLLERLKRAGMTFKLSPSEHSSNE